MAFKKYLRPSEQKLTKKIGMPEKKKKIAYSKMFVICILKTKGLFISANRVISWLSGSSMLTLQ